MPMAPSRNHWHCLLFAKINPTVPLYAYRFILTKYPFVFRSLRAACRLYRQANILYNAWLCFFNDKTYLTSNLIFGKIELIRREGLGKSGSTKEKDNEKAGRQAADGCSKKEKSNIIHNRLPVFNGNPCGIYFFEFLFRHAGQSWGVCETNISGDFRKYVVSAAVSADLCFRDVYRQ